MLQIGLPFFQITGTTIEWDEIRFDVRLMQRALSALALWLEGRVLTCVSFGGAGVPYEGVSRMQTSLRRFVLPRSTLFCTRASTCTPLCSQPCVWSRFSSLAGVTVTVLSAGCEKAHTQTTTLSPLLILLASTTSHAVLVLVLQGLGLIIGALLPRSINTKLLKSSRFLLLLFVRRVGFLRHRRWPPALCRCAFSPSNSYATVSHADRQNARSCVRRSTDREPHTPCVLPLRFAAPLRVLTPFVCACASVLSSRQSIRYCVQEVHT